MQNSHTADPRFTRAIPAPHGLSPGSHALSRRYTAHPGVNTRHLRAIVGIPSSHAPCWHQTALSTPHTRHLWKIIHPCIRTISVPARDAAGLHTQSRSRADTRGVGTTPLGIRRMTHHPQAVRSVDDESVRSSSGDADRRPTKAAVGSGAAPHGHRNSEPTPVESSVVTPMVASAMTPLPWRPRSSPDRLGFMVAEAVH